MSRKPTIPAEHLVAATAMAAAMPGVTAKAAAEELGVSTASMRRRVPNIEKPRLMPQSKITDRARDVVARVNMTAEELGADLTDAAQAQAVAAKVADGIAVDLTANVMERQRKEWSVPRKLLYDAIQSGQQPGAVVDETFNKLKLAKIAAETVSILHLGERLAHGIKPSELERPSVLIDRGDGDE